MKRDGICEVYVSDDAMEARATFLPAIEDGSPLEPSYVGSVLESSKVVSGIDWDTIHDAIFRANTEHHAVEDLIVAAGTPPKPERPAHFRVLPIHIRGRRNDNTLDEIASDRVDFKAATKIDVVHSGQVVAKLIPAQVGEPGWTVRGDEIPFGKESVTAPEPGKNTVVKDDRVFAAKGGQLVSTDKTFFVEDRLELGEGVDYHTGSIEFPGDVVIKGGVKAGFHVWAGGSIEVFDTIDVSEIYVRKDFACRGGIVGTDKRLLRSGGRIQTRFIGNCYVESKSSIFVKDYIYQSHVSSRDQIAMEKNGKVIGGSVTAGRGIKCHQIGNSANVPTLARAGIDFIAERKLRVTRERLEQLSIQLEKLRKKAGDPPTARQVDVLDRIESARNRLAQQMSEVTDTLDMSEEATIEVFGTVFPGVTIQICRATYTVDEEASSVVFLLDKNSGRVVRQDIQS